MPTAAELWAPLPVWIPWKEKNESGSAAWDAHVLAAMRVPQPKGTGQRDVYQVCTFTPLNFRAQQHRTLHLISALHNRRRVAGQRIAVIGGGLAGVTAASAAMLLGAESVALYERSHLLMGLQDGAHHRFVHPFIASWPKEDSGKENAGLPILNWKAGTADQIRNTVLQQATTFYLGVVAQRNNNAAAKGDGSKPPEPYYHCVGADVREIIPSGDKKTLVVIAEGYKQSPELSSGYVAPVGPKRTYYYTYDVVIITAGFGLERTDDRVPFRSYWDTDSIDQAVITKSEPKRYLVSGNGDGGLTDLVRLMAQVDAPDGRNQNYHTGGYIKSLIDKLTATTGPAVELRKKLLSAHEAARSSIQFGNALQQSYDAISHDEDFKWFVASLGRELAERQRTDTIVYLNGTTPTPYSPNASQLNLFILYLLRRYCGLRYRPGKLDFVSAAPPHGPYRVRFKVDNEPSAPLTDGNAQPAIESPTSPELDVDEIYLRHGSIPALERLLPLSLAKLIRDSDASSEFGSECDSYPLNAEFCDQLLNAALNTVSSAATASLEGAHVAAEEAKNAESTEKRFTHVYAAETWAGRAQMVVNTAKSLSECVPSELKPQADGTRAKAEKCAKEAADVAQAAKAAADSAAH